MKPEKPFPDFPLFPHANGQFAKKIDGRTVYFGTDWRQALAKYYALMNGTQDAPATSLKTCVNQYLQACRLRQESGAITASHVQQIDETLSGLLKSVGPSKSLVCLSPEDYGVWRATLAKTNGTASLGNHVGRLRAFLRWCKREAKVLHEVPDYDALKKPSRAAYRIARAARGSRMFTPKEIHRLLFCAGPQMKAMILLAINCALGNNDLALLKTNHLQGGGWSTRGRRPAWKGKSLCGRRHVRRYSR